MICNDSKWDIFGTADILTFIDTLNILHFGLSYVSTLSWIVHNTLVEEDEVDRCIYTAELFRNYIRLSCKKIKSNKNVAKNKFLTPMLYTAS